MPLADQSVKSELAQSLESTLTLAADQAGFLLVPDGLEALAIRLMLADMAEQSIDAQYYEIDNDFSGHVFLEALLRAADRGVKVRLLLDDYRTKGHDAELATLRMHPNFEIRIYNPFSRSKTRARESVMSFTRVNRRMHNKSFTVDDVITVTGGRNIGDPYFGIGSDVNFSDLDVIGVGTVVADVSGMFTEFWQDQASTPVEKLDWKNASSETSFAKVLKRVTQSRSDIGNSKYAAAISDDMRSKLQADWKHFVISPYELTYDYPGKTQRDVHSARVRGSLSKAFEKVQREVMIVSPYFVPRLTGIKKFQNLRDRNVDITIVTNSLASNNQIYAHGGYAPVRRPLLKMGVSLYELSAQANLVADNPKQDELSKATLHAKAFSLDRTRLFVGSFNLDPRSANINTEMGLLIDSPILAEQFASGCEHFAPRFSYRLKLSSQGKLRWCAEREGQLLTLDKEPHATLFRRIAGRLAQWLPIRGQV